MKYSAARLFFLLLAPFAAFHDAQAANSDYPSLDEDDSAWIGNMIFHNECSSRPACLTAWNEGEDFPSMGIGHFIWYRAGQREVFEESFPALLSFLASQAVPIPQWLEADGYDNPWPDREAFIDDFDGQRLTGLRALLLETIPQQTAFIVARFEAALDTMGAESGPTERAVLEERFMRVANSHPPHGLYALIDYVNFKGEGVSPRERYQGQGWGLRQVLLGMEPSPGTSLEAFVRSARGVLSNRVANAPAARNEARWLPGWLNRLDTYLPPQDIVDTTAADADN